MKTAFIINPISGKRSLRGDRKEWVDAFVQREGLDASVKVTQRPGHATELAQLALQDGARRVVCVGGDGTINEVAKALLGTDCVFGMVPMGSGNGLARHLHIPLTREEALKNVISGNDRLIDAGEANGIPFFNVMGIGLDAEIGKRFNDTEARGFAAYMKEGLSSIMSFRSSSYMLEQNGSNSKLKASIIAVANSSQYGSNAYIAPDARVDDGKLNLVAISPLSILKTFDLFVRLFSKTIYGSRSVKAFCSDAFKLALPGSGFFHADGEIFDCGSEISIRTLPRSLRIAVPA